MMSRIRNQRKSILFLWQFLKKEGGLLVLGIVMTGLVSLLTWVGPKIIAYIIDQGLVPHEHRLAMIGVLVLGAAELARLSSLYLSQLVYAVMGQNVIERVRAKMVSHLLNLPVAYYDRVSSGKMMTRVVSDVNSLTDFFQSGFVSVLGNFAGMVAIFVGLMSISLRLGLVLFFSFIPIALACALFSVQLKKVYELTRNQLSHLNAMLADFLYGMRTIRSLGSGYEKFQELSRQIERYAAAQMKMVRTYSLFHPTLSLGIGILLLILINMGLPMVSENVMKVGEWVAALSYVLSLQQPLLEISDRWNFFLAGMTSIERIMEVFAEVPETVGGVHPARFRAIEFNRVCFAYAEEQVLNHVNLKIRAGEWLGVYGESGSGKSTLLQMLYGFYHATEGELLWNGTSYRELDLKVMRTHFGVIEQFPFLFAGTIAENISLFGEHQFELEALKKEFQGFSLIESLLNQPNFEINERGSNLSMGQKQMIAFLRAYLANPDIWILDEATAFFDEEAEQEVMLALEKQRNKITVIQVAHRAEALRRMDRLIQISFGQLQDHRPSLS